LGLFLSLSFLRFFSLLDENDDHIFGGGFFQKRHHHHVSPQPSFLSSFNTSHLSDEIVELADKLDAMLSLLLSFSSQFLARNTSNPIELNRFFVQLLDLFVNRCLITHKSKYVQFVFFYIASQQPETFGIMFCQRLLELILNNNESMYLRQSAMMYLASYLSRSSFLPLDLIK
jgi:hypothetical protein